MFLCLKHAPNLLEILLNLISIPNIFTLNCPKNKTRSCDSGQEALANRHEWRDFSTWSTIFEMRFSFDPQEGPAYCGEGAFVKILAYESSIFLASHMTIFSFFHVLAFYKSDAAPRRRLAS